MRTVALEKLLSSMQPGTALMGICFTPCSVSAAVTTRQLRSAYPTDVPQSATSDPVGLLRVVKELQVLSSYATSCAVVLCSKAVHMHMQVGGLMLGGSALFRTNGLTQFGARHLVSRVGGDPFSNIGENEEAMQLPVALWCACMRILYLNLLSGHNVVAYKYATITKVCQQSYLMPPITGELSSVSNLYAGLGQEMIQPK